jgi:hypothetical protein
MKSGDAYRSFPCRFFFEFFIGVDEVGRWFPQEVSNKVVARSKRVQRFSPETYAGTAYRSMREISRGTRKGEEGASCNYP